MKTPAAKIAKSAFGSPIQFSSPVTRIEWSGRLIEVETRGTAFTARAVIVTASTGVLSSGKIKFQPGLPARHAEAIAKLGLGSYEHVANSSAPTLSNNMIQKGLAFGRDWSGSVVNSGR